MYTVVYSRGESVQYCSGMFEKPEYALAKAKKLAKKKAKQFRETWTKAGYEVHTTIMNMHGTNLFGTSCFGCGMLVETIRSKPSYDYKDVDIAYFHVAEIRNEE